MRILILNELQTCKTGLPRLQIKTCTGASQLLRTFFWTTKLTV